MMNDIDKNQDDFINEDQEIEKALRPKLFSDFDGQEKIVSNLEVFIAAAKKERKFIKSK